MADIELLVLPQHLLRQRLLQIEDALVLKQHDVSAWLESYLVDKYGLGKTIEEDIEKNEAQGTI